MAGSGEKRRSDFSIARILGDDKSTLCGGGGGGGGGEDEDEDGREESVGDGGSDARENSKLDSQGLEMCGELEAGGELQWLQCTRYRPPRLPRKHSNRNSKRRPATHPRIPFTTFQLDALEERYKSGPYLTRKDVLQLAGILRLPQSRVKIWFQNRRARDRRENKVSSSLSIA